MVGWDHTPISLRSLSLTLSNIDFYLGATIINVLLFITFGAATKFFRNIWLFVIHVTMIRRLLFSIVRIWGGDHTKSILLILSGALNFYIKRTCYIYFGGAICGL